MSALSREETQALIQEVLEVYPDKAKNERAKHLAVNDQSVEQSKIRITSNRKSQPGVMTIRGCAYAGSKGGVWGPIKDMIHISHGPVGCGQYSRAGRRNYYVGMTGGNTFGTMYFTSDFQEKDIVFGDDLNAFIGNSKKEGYIPEDFPTPFAHTPSFVGSHTTGWDNIFEGIQRYFTLNAMDDKEVGSNGKVNIVPGFETYLGNHRVMRRMMSEMGVEYSLLCDPTEVLDTPADGEYRMYDGGTTIDEVKDAPNAVDTLYLQPWQSVKSKKFTKNTWHQPVSDIHIPMGLEWTDNFMMKVAELTGKPIPASLAKERGRLVDMMTDSHAWLHGKKFAFYGDADFAMGMTKFLMELGAGPTHVLVNHANKRYKKALDKLCSESPYGQATQTRIGKDLWHFRSLMFTDKPDFMIGNSYGKFIQRDTLHKGKELEVPLIRIGFPIFDRHHLHRMTTMGYEGAMYILTTLVNAVLERLDEETRGMGTTDYNYDLIR